MKSSLIAALAAVTAMGQPVPPIPESASTARPTPTRKPPKSGGRYVRRECAGCHETATCSPVRRDDGRWSYLCKPCRTPATGTDRGECGV